jgi:Fe2+-dicitrate sensor, membrane component
MNDMRPDPDYIHILMVEKLGGTIGESEGKYLDKLIEQDTHVREIWEKLRSRYNPEDLDNQFERYKTGEGWSHIIAGVSQRKPQIRRWTWVAAAMIAGILVGGYYLFTKNGIKPSAPLAAIDSNGNQKTVQLQIVGGKTIDLSANKGQVAIGATILNNTGKALSYSTEDANREAAGENILTVPIGLDYRIQLSDGTEVWLNSATTMRFPFRFAGSTRAITLSGEAFLKVAKDVKRPFIVHLAGNSGTFGGGDQEGTSVQVLGTEFNVNTYDSGSFRVALVDGSVKMKAPRQEVTIKPGQQATYSEQQKSIAINKFDEEEVLSWRDGVLFFRNTTIREICQVFPRWYGVEITTDNKKLDDAMFTGVLNRNEPLKEFLNLLKATHTISGYYFDNVGELHLQ